MAGLHRICCCAGAPPANCDCSDGLTQVCCFDSDHSYVTFSGDAGADFEFRSCVHLGAGPCGEFEGAWQHRPIRIPAVDLAYIGCAIYSAASVPGFIASVGPRSPDCVEPDVPTFFDITVRYQDGIDDGWSVDINWHSGFHIDPPNNDVTPAFDRNANFPEAWVAETINQDDCLGADIETTGCEGPVHFSDWESHFVLTVKQNGCCRRAGVCEPGVPTSNGVCATGERLLLDRGFVLPDQLLLDSTSGDVLLLE